MGHADGVSVMAASFTGTPSAGLMIVSFAIFLGFPLLMIVWVTAHVNRRNRRGGRCARCYNIQRNKQWTQNGHSH